MSLGRKGAMPRLALDHIRPLLEIAKRTRGHEDEQPANLIAVRANRARSKETETQFLSTGTGRGIGRSKPRPPERGYGTGRKFLRQSKRMALIKGGLKGDAGHVKGTLSDHVLCRRDEGGTGYVGREGQTLFGISESAPPEEKQ